MAQRRLDISIVCRHEHVQWLTGARVDWTNESAALLSADGCCTLIVPEAVAADCAVDGIATYQANHFGTLRNDQRQMCSAALLEVMSPRARPRRIGIESSALPYAVSARLEAELVDIEPEVYRLRRRKAPDEMILLRRAINATGAMYQRAREMIRPGVRELDVFRELQSVAVDSLGEMSSVSGNDFQCGTPGGPPRDNVALAGELYILDLGVPCRGYFADNCRTIAVGGAPTDDQYRAWEAVVRALEIVETTVKPGVSCRELYISVKSFLDDFLPGAFWHHLGHGIGLFPHEAPHLNPDWDDFFEIGDVFTAEPGLYAPSLRGGIRLENDYLVTERGIELLSDFPLNL